MERKKVVLADDVELFLMLENTFFNRDDFEMITARGGQEVLKIIRSSNPDMVFINLDMPDLSGDECCRILKNDESFRHIPVVMVSPTGLNEDMERCRRAGCDDVVTKPIKRHDFMDTSRKFLKVKERADKRFSLRLAVNYAVISGDILNDYTIDLNTGGMFLATDRLLEVDTMLHLEFVLPGIEKTIRCMAKVAWVNGPEARKKAQLPNGLGVCFLDLSDADMEAIKRSIEYGLSGDGRDI